jgi:DNA-binding transcriptional MocR family regulator
VYSCVKRSKVGPGACGNVSIVTHMLDTRVWRDVTKRISDRDFLAAEIARLREDDPTGPDLSTVERALSEVARRQTNTSRAIGMLDDDAVAPLVAELRRLTEQRRGLERERRELIAQRAIWEASQARLADIEAWCQSMAIVLNEDLSYTQRRSVLEALRVRVRIFRADHTPRYRVDAIIGPDGEEDTVGGVTPATAPSLVLRPRTSTRSGCW